MARVSEPLFSVTPEQSPLFAEVAVPLFVRQTYTYRIPSGLAARTKPGCRVFVPFGRKIVTGYVVALHTETDQELDPHSIKDVEELLDDEPVITDEILRLTQWVADYYYAPWGECLRAALPAGLATSSEPYLTITERGRIALAGVDARRRASTIYKALERVAAAGTLRARDLRDEMTPARASAISRELERQGFVLVSQRVGEERVRPKKQNAVRLVAGATDVAKISEAQRRVLDRLEAAPTPIPFSTLLAEAEISPSVIRTLEKRGRVEVFSQEVRRDPLAHVAIERSSLLELTDAQRGALDQIEHAVKARDYKAFLLHGVTGSGKTEIYIRAMHATLEEGRSALMLVPEINLTPVFSRRLAQHFGSAVAILHSELSDGERLDEWRRIRRGEARVVIGTRSAVFAPLDDVGLIVVDEEHETSYKQEETPRYHGRDTAVYRARESKSVVVLGSATPSLETFHNAHNGKYDYIRLAERIGGRSLATVETVDMREVFRASGKQEIIAPQFVAAIGETHARGEQSIVLLNRRGYSSFLICRSCGL